jgi:hypothetical protein
MSKPITLDATLRLWDLEAGRALGSFGEFGSWDRVPRVEEDNGRRRLSDVLRAVLAAGRTGLEYESGFMDEGPPGVWSDGRVAIVADGVFEVSSGLCLRTLAGEAYDVTLDGRYVLAREGEDESPVVSLIDAASGERCKTFTSASPESSLPRFARGKPANPDAVTVKIKAAGARGAILTAEDVSGDHRDVHTFGPGHNARSAFGGVVWAAISGDGRLAVWHDLFFIRAELRHRGSFVVCELDYELEGRDGADWDEGARPYLDAFLSIHKRVAGGAPSWSELDFEKLNRRLGRDGYGWLRPPTVRRELDRMAKEWRGAELPTIG